MAGFSRFRMVGCCSRCVGACGGTWGKLPQGESSVGVLSEADAVEVMRRLRRWGKRSRYLRGVGRRNNLYYITQGERTGPLGFAACGVGASILRGVDDVNIVSTNSGGKDDKA